MASDKTKAGDRFGKLVALERAGTGTGRNPLWRFRCDCGAEAVLLAYLVKGGRTQSCGCLFGKPRTNGREAAKPVREARVTRPFFGFHGLSKSPEHHIWRSMRRRCRDPKQQSYPKYGGRGISICARWDSFQNFYADMGPRPSPYHSIDRIDGAAGYSPENCRWAETKVQNRNRRTARMVEYGGQMVSLAEACERASVKYALVLGRLRRGWSLERAMQKADL